MVYEVRGLTGREGSADKAWAMAVSEDGINWQKPDIGLLEHDGSKNNNWFPTPDGCRLWHVVYDPDDEDERRRYKGLLKLPGGHLPVISPDGLHWTKLDVPLLPSGDAGSLTYDRDNGRFLALLKFQGANGRAYNLSTSEDFVHWSDLEVLFETDARDQEDALEAIRSRLCHPGLAKPLFVEPDPALGWRRPTTEREYRDVVWRAECYNIGLFPYEGMHIALLMIFYPTGQSLPSHRNTDGFDLIQLAMSRDLKTWNRLGNRASFIGPSPLTDGLVGNYDRLQLQPTNQPIDRGDHLWFYYEGMKRRVPQHDRWLDGSPRDPTTLSTAERADWLEDTHTGIYVRELRKDGFVSLDSDNEGTVLTQPLLLSGEQLRLNADAENGEVRVAILDAEGRDIDGYERANALPIAKDRVSAVVGWKGARDIRMLTGKPVRLRFHLRDARLYSFWTE